MKFTGSVQILPVYRRAGNCAVRRAALRPDFARPRVHFAGERVLSWSTMVLMCFQFENIDLTYDGDLARQGPRATAVGLGAVRTGRQVGCQKVTLSVRSFQCRRSRHHGLAARAVPFRCPPPATRGSTSGGEGAKLLASVFRCP